MNKILKTILTFMTAFMLAVPTYAGEIINIPATIETQQTGVQLKTSIPLYIVKEGYTITEEEQRFMDTVLNYFIANPDAQTVDISTEDFPNLNYDFFYNLNDKLDFITAHYPTSISYETCRYSDYLFWTHGKNYDRQYTIYTFENCYVNDAVKIQNWINYTYALLPQIGIYDGMNEREAISVIHDFICNLLEFDVAYKGDYQNLYATHKGVCMDYSILFQALCEGSSIKTYTLSNDIHSWNRVILSGQEYEIDVLWNDQNNKRAYYLMSREEMHNVEYHENILKVR